MVTKTHRFCLSNLSTSLVPPKSKGAALIALTGDGIFVRHIQDKARRLGLYLNEFGLWKWEDGVCKLVCSGSEEEIFQHLGMDFVDPTRRNFALLKAAR
jgi:DNA polymerase beta